MPKLRMLCPFSSRPCRDCSLYRGRHYSLCFSEGYRGYLGTPGEGARSAGASRFNPGSDRRALIPRIGVRRPIELFAVVRDAPHEER
jgi:hypothetical protein